LNQFFEPQSPAFYRIRSETPGVSKKDRFLELLVSGIVSESPVILAQLAMFPQDR
jgi:hypothetical protein